jgi:hypothetical protein
MKEYALSKTVVSFVEMGNVMSGQLLSAIQQEEWQLLQVSVLDALYAGLPGLVIGFLVGFILGASKSLSTRDRFFITIAAGLFGGVIITSLLLTTNMIIINPDDDPARLSMMFLLSIMTTFGGIGVGAVLHWEPFAAPPPKRHVTFDPEEDDEEFDRQLKDAMGG